MSDLADLLVRAFQHQIGELYTATPAVIVSVRDIAQQRVDVKPLIKLITPNGDYEEHPVILSVPLVFPSTKTSAITFDVNAGDEVFLVFAHSCIDGYKASGGISDPIDLRRFDKRDAVAFIGMGSFAKAINNPTKRTLPHNTSDLVVAHNIGTGNEVEIRLKKDGSLSITTPSSVNIQGDLNVNGDVIVTGSLTVTQSVTASVDVIGGGISLKNHTHVGSPTAPSGAISNTGAPI